MIKIDPKADVWVFAEQHRGQLADVPLELLGKARTLADRLGVQLAAVLLGDKVEGLTKRLISYGADKVILAEHPLLAQYQTNSYAKVVCELIRRYQPQIVLYGATVTGRDLAPRIASDLKAGLTADCTDLQIGDHKPANEDRVYKNLLFQIRPAFGGNIIATIINYQRWPQMATVREGVMRMADPDPNRKGKVIRYQVDLGPQDLSLEILQEHQEPRRVNLKAARIIVAGGAGVGSRENFRLIWDLANCLGGAPAGSRAAVDLGFIDHQYQVGQTGTTVRPALYIAIGISGAIQHRAGMEESQKIVAINKDPDAPIFSIAHYKIVADLNDVVPRLIKALKEKATR